MINRRTLIGLASVTLVLMIASAAIGEGSKNELWIFDDVIWFGFLACALSLIVLSVGVLVRSLTRSRRPGPTRGPSRRA